MIILHYIKLAPDVKSKAPCELVTLVAATHSRIFPHYIYALSCYYIPTYVMRHICRMMPVLLVAGVSHQLDDEEEDAAAAASFLASGLDHEEVDVVDDCAAAVVAADVVDSVDESRPNLEDGQRERWVADWQFG